MHVQWDRERGISNMMQRGREATKEEDEALTLGAPKERDQQRGRGDTRKPEESEVPLKLRGNYFRSYPLRYE